MELGQLHGLFQANCSLYLPLTILAFLIVGFLGMPLIVWTILVLAASHFWGAPVELTGALLAVFLIFLVKPIRQATMSKLVLTIMQKLQIMPKISETEKNGSRCRCDLD